MDEVLGSKPNITLKVVVECGLAEDATATAVSDSEASPESNIPADHESDKDLEQEFEKNLNGNPKMSLYLHLHKINCICLLGEADFRRWLMEYTSLECID